MIGGYGFRSYPNFNSRDQIFPRVHDPEGETASKDFETASKRGRRPFYSRSQIYIYTYTFSSSNVWSNNSSAVWKIGEPFRICFRRTDRSFLFSFERLVLVICLPPRDVDPLTNRRAVTRHLFLSATRQLFLPREEEEDEEDEVDDDADLTLGRKIRQSSLVIFVPRKVDSEISGPIRKSRRTRRSERDTLGTNTM